MLFLQGYLLAQPQFVEGEEVELAFPEQLLGLPAFQGWGEGCSDDLFIYLPSWVAEETLVR